MKMAAMPKLCVTSDNFCDLWDAIDEKDHTWIYECVAQWDLKIFILCLRYEEHTRA